MASVLVPTLKKTIDLTVPNGCQLLFTRAEGIGYARQLLAEKARHSLLIYCDDDVDIPKNTWQRLLEVNYDEVVMLEGARHPIARIIALHKETLEKLGGWDKDLCYTAEDLDLYCKALKNGVKVSVLPYKSVSHRPHIERNKYKRYWESAYIVAKHGFKFFREHGMQHRTPARFFIRKNPLQALLRLLGYTYYKVIKNV